MHKHTEHIIYNTSPQIKDKLSIILRWVVNDPEHVKPNLQLYVL